jgi:hypothetical protein
MHAAFEGDDDENQHNYFGFAYGCLPSRRLA